MQVIGIRSSAKEIRYAILEKNINRDITFLNKDKEHCLKYPSNISDIEEKLLWVKKEFERILRQNPEIEKIIIKVNEFNGSETLLKRESAYIDAIILLLSAEKHIKIDRKLYQSIGTSSKQTKEIAEMRVGKTDKYWNTSIADAINSAYWGLEV